MLIARALCVNPKVLLLDEPLSNLDARLRLKIREEIRQLIKEINITTIFVTHDQEEALSISDQIVLMDQGNIQQIDEPQNLYLEPANLFVAKFMGNPIINIINVTLENGRIISNDLSFDISRLNVRRFKKEVADGEYYLGVRPEYFNINDNNPLINVPIRDVELIGKDRISNFNLNGENCKLITDVTTIIKQGQNVGLDIDFNSIYLFDKQGVRVY